MLVRCICLLALFVELRQYAFPTVTSQNVSHEKRLLVSSVGIWVDSVAQMNKCLKFSA